MLRAAQKTKDSLSPKLGREPLKKETEFKKYGNKKNQTS
jgi:hypothetical protein